MVSPAPRMGAALLRTGPPDLFIKRAPSNTIFIARESGGMADAPDLGFILSPEVLAFPVN